jgi:hypothetical protein
MLEDLIIQENKKKFKTMNAIIQNDSILKFY